MDLEYKNKIIDIDVTDICPYLRGSNRMEEVGQFEFGPRHNYAYQLLYVIAGEGRARLNRQTYVMQPGQCYLYGPKDEHHFVQGNSALAVGTINFSWRLEAPARLAKKNASVKTVSREFWECADPNYRIQSWPAFPVVVDIPVALRGHMERLIDLIALNFSKVADNQSLTLRGDFMSLLGLIQQSLLPRRSGVHPDDGSHLYRLYQYINKHMHQDINRSSVAAALGISASHLTTILRGQVSTNFSALLTRERMARAQVLLQYSDQQIKTIAAQVGYKDTSYFVRVFRETHGSSPQTWREQFR